MGQTLYMECASGISGDMTVGMLIDLGADTSVLCEAIASLPVEGASVEISRVNKKGVDACDFDVRLDHDLDNHDHDMEYLHGHTGVHHHDHDDHDHDDHHDHGDHDHDDHHDHHDHDDHHHEHHHRTLAEVYEIIDAGKLTEGANAIAKKIFAVLGEAEAHAHETTVEKVHFHEVGAIDSIVDIISIAVCIDNLDITDVIVESIAEGEGEVRTQHGLLSIPVPAVKYLLDAYDIKTRQLHIMGEHVTPTGASVVAALRTSKELPASYEVIREGIGAGKREYESAGILRGQLIR